MDTNSLIFTLIIGAVCGWLAGVIRQGYGFGLLGNIVVGILGAFVGGWLFRVLGIGIAGLGGTIITAVIGALILLFLIGLIKRT
ncbi:MAG: GlsB/YeaQ/YmgE family stress response membrane protein [Saprospiraceae bacterium]